MYTFVLESKLEEMNARNVSWILATLLLVVAFWKSSIFIADQSSLNTLSYWGTVATVLALLLAIAELVHSIRTAKTLQEQTLTILHDVKRVENASTLSECVAELDNITREISSERYEAALAGFQHFRRLLVRAVASTDLPPVPAGSLNEMGELELKLITATRVTVSAGLSKPQKRELLNRLLVLKQIVEAKNPATGVPNAACKD